jgi:hypothetical protein
MKFNLKTILKTLVFIVLGLIVLSIIWFIGLGQDSSRETDQYVALQDCLFYAPNVYTQNNHLQDAKNDCYLEYSQFYYPELFFDPWPMVWNRYAHGINPIMP